LVRLTSITHHKYKKYEICDGRDSVRVAMVSNMQHKRCSIFTMDERGNAKIELLSSLHRHSTTTVAPRNSPRL
jgi:hypothetical protein